MNNYWTEHISPALDLENMMDDIVEDFDDTQLNALQLAISRRQRALRDAHVRNTGRPS